MTIHPAVGANHLVGLRIASTVTGTLLLLLILLATLRPEMMSMAALHTLMTAAGL